jgi:hypothetical protein
MSVLPMQTPGHYKVAHVAGVCQQKHLQRSKMYVSSSLTRYLSVNASIQRPSSGETCIDALPHKPLSLKSPLIFGPLGLPQRLHLLRDLKRIELTVHINERSLYAIRRHRERIQHFVDVLHAHAEDRSKKNLLQDLHVKLTISAPRDWTRRVQFSQYPDLNGFITLDQFEKHMFTLESLAEVTGVPTVIFDGIPGWWKQCLELRMQGGR